MNDEAESERAQILPILEAIVEAIDRRAEVMQWVFAAASPAAAEETVMERLSVDRTSARSVLSLQFRSLTEQSRQTIARERDRLRAG